MTSQQAKKLTLAGKMTISTILALPIFASIHLGAHSPLEPQSMSFYLLIACHRSGFTLTNKAVFLPKRLTSVRTLHFVALGSLGFVHVLQQGK